jgi:anti-sigma regulatory factor (Ser/Thr protein kinase)
MSINTPDEEFVREGTVDGMLAYFAMPVFPRGPWPWRDTVELATAPSAVSAARRHVRETLWEWKLDFLADDAELVVAELAANAVRETAAQAGASGVTLRVLGGPSRLLILMRDGVLGPPVLPLVPPGTDAVSGRGLLLVEALAARWHWYHPPRPAGGKVVWALLERTDMLSCTCGFASADLDELGDHLQEMLSPDDDRDADGVIHAEASRDHAGQVPPHRCLCGHQAGDLAALDRHLLAVFTPADQIGRDGHQHAPADAGPAGAGT